MIILTNNDNNIWDKLFAYVYDNFMFVADIIWNTKLPLTDVSIGYWLLFWLIIRLSIYAVNGTGTQYNTMASELHTSSATAYSRAAKYTPRTQASKKRQLNKFNTNERHRNMKSTKFDRKNKVINNKSKFGGTRSNK